eukprot:6624424-Alexandrium_andersonii.AAC.1
MPWSIGSPFSGLAQHVVEGVEKAPGNLLECHRGADDATAGQRRVGAMLFRLAENTIILYRDGGGS